MFKNYIIVAYRNLTRNKLYSIIIITGLAIGLAGCLLIVGYVSHELSFENSHLNGNRIFRVDGYYVVGDSRVSMANISAPIGPALKEAFPEVEEMARFRRIWDAKVELQKNQTVTESKFLIAEPSLLRIFTILLKEGNPGTALSAPFSVIISEEISHRYFPNQNPIGQTIKVNNEYEFQITGVFQTLPANTQIQTNFIASYSSLEKTGKNPSGWKDIFYDYTFLLLNEKADAKQVGQKIPALLEKQIGDDAKLFDLRLQPLKHIYLNSDLSYELPPQGNLTYVYVFSCVAVVILIIACINFINLTTARTVHRIKEVGMRKVLGACRSHLVKQFLSESALITILAMFLGVVLFELALPRLEAFLGRDLEITIYRNPQILLSIVGMIIVVGLLSGGYPAFLLSRYQPIMALRGSVLGTSRKSLSRKILVAIQFTIAIAIVGVTLLIYNQMHYAITKDLGYDKENMLMLKFDDKISQDKVLLMKQEILENTSAVNATAIRVPPVSGNYYLYSLHPENKAQDENVMLSMFIVDYDFLSTFGIGMVDGRYFSMDQSAADKNAIVLNETAVKAYGIENPIGFKFNAKTLDFNVIGVVKDFHNVTLKQPIPPLALRIIPEEYHYLAVKLPTNNQQAAITTIKDVWNRILPEYPFSYDFLEELVRRDWENEQKMRSLFTAFSMVAVFIACLGLFGLAAFVAEKRTKEIGIRKVLGASVSSIVRLLSREVVILIAISNVIAWPIVYYIGYRWLQSFAYRTNIGWSLFVISGILVLTIGLLTVCFQAVRAAIANPVDSLRYE